MSINSLKEKLLNGFPDKGKIRVQKMVISRIWRLQISDKTWKKLILGLI